MVISEEVEDKLRNRHQVSSKEVEECLQNITGSLLFDRRDEHKTTPPTRWFIAETNQRRELKVCIMMIGTDIHIKSAFEPNEEEKRIYKKYSKTTT
ncbi:ADP-ribosyl-(dinitrogen reductase) hydrolase [Pectobacterium versatile]|nr:ADP-ribosyl-(dinitrogen reductase) hydrolase [Pectobacterium versatile]